MTIYFANLAGENSTAPITITPKVPPQNGSKPIRFSLGQDFSIKPSRPIYFINEELKELHIFSPTIEISEKFAQSRCITEKSNHGFSINPCTDLTSHIKEIFININPESLVILRGVLKIAIEFALHASIERSTIEHLLEKEDITNNDKILQSCVIQYYPTTSHEKIYETLKFDHEDNYPTHQLYLFNIGHNLYCYVEIFGTIQKYIHLSNKYTGNKVEEKYIQRATKYEFDESIFIAHDLKDLHILAGENGVDISKYKNNPDWWEKCQSDILHAARKRAYQLEPDEQIKKVTALMHRVLEIETFKLTGKLSINNGFSHHKNNR